MVHVVAEGEQPKSVPEPMALPTTDGKASPTVLPGAPAALHKTPHQEAQRKQASSSAFVLPKRPK